MRKEKLEELKSLIEELKVIKLENQGVPGKFVTSTLYKCTLNNGEVIMRDKLLKGNKEGSAAIILPVTKSGEIVLSVEPRVFTKRGVGISVPAGYIEEGETAKEAAIRELHEETGYVPSLVTYLGGFYQDMGVSAAYNEAFIAEGCIKTGEGKLDQGEFVKPFLCTYSECLELMDLGYIQGSNAIITLTKANKYMKGI